LSARCRSHNFVGLHNRHATPEQSWPSWSTSAESLERYSWPAAGDTPLHIARRYNHMELEGWLLRHGADEGVTNGFGWKAGVGKGGPVERRSE
jgi:hypothetical protein